MSRNAKIALGVVAVLALGGFGLRIASNARARTVEVTGGEIARAIVARAEVVPANGVTHVSPEVAGRVTEVLVRVGDAVEEDETLLRLDPASDRPSFDLLGENERIRAPVAGVVLARHVEPGDALGTLVPSPEPLFAIADPSALELRIEIEERDANAVAVGTTVRVGEREAQIARLSPRIERRAHPLDDVASRARADVRVAWAPLPEGAEAIVGQHLEVVVREAPTAVAALVPRDAVEVRDGDAFVRVRDGVWVRDARVTLGVCDDESVAVESVAAGVEVVLP